MSKTSPSRGEFAPLRPFGRIATVTPPEAGQSQVIALPLRDAGIASILAVCRLVLSATTADSPSSQRRAPGVRLVKEPTQSLIPSKERIHLAGAEGVLSMVGGRTIDGIEQEGCDPQPNQIVLMIHDAGQAAALEAESPGSLTQESHSSLRGRFIRPLLQKRSGKI